MASYLIKFLLFIFLSYAQKYRDGNTDYRTLSKVHGLRFVVSISGKGGRFNIVNLFVAIGKIRFFSINNLVYF
jgi:hypothetical protein